MSLKRRRQCILQVSGNTLQQVETFKYLGMVFTSYESRNKGIDTRMTDWWSKRSSVWALLLRGDETEAFKDCTAFSFKSVFVPILTCGHESKLTTERMLVKE